MDNPKPGTPEFEYPRGDRMRELLAPFRPPEAKTVLDMGCGDGLKASRYHLGLKIVGLEADPGKAKEAFYNLGSCVCHGMSCLQYIYEKENVFDWITFIDSIEHVTLHDAQEILRHASRVAKYAVTIFAPDGDTSEWRHKDAELDVHSSIWNEAQFTALGFTVTRLSGHHGPGRDALIAHWRKPQ